MLETTALTCGEGASTKELLVAERGARARPRLGHLNRCNSRYWLAFDKLASLVPPKGYPALPTGTRCAGGGGLVGGAIGVRYRALGGCGSVLGAPKTNELSTPDRIGRYNVFERGSIYWTAASGAHEVDGAALPAYLRRMSKPKLTYFNAPISRGEECL